MVLKRKRSEAELSSSPSSVSSFNSPPQNMAGIRNPFPTIDVSPIHLHSRTMKRFRNSRPSEEVVHQRTLNMLYAAQQQPNMDIMVTPEQDQMQQQPTRPEVNQQSLHRFWKISSTPSASLSTSSSVQPLPTTASNCDDCGACLTENSGDDTMDVDGSGIEAHSCGACSKSICFSCSVSNLGEQRRCLQCAGRQVWANGARRVTPGFSVC
ncbi:hypothetical protein BGZ63DRAFT_419251 [Mariannaea sp. PMI_226]|nr:hypothetical protein BGZ63DRAFT_419251 [Mariannaea sp. PMI_226]